MRSQPGWTAAYSLEQSDECEKMPRPCFQDSRFFCRHLDVLPRYRRSGPVAETFTDQDFSPDKATTFRTPTLHVNLSVAWSFHIRQSCDGSSAARKRAKNAGEPSSAPWAGAGVPTKRLSRFEKHKRNKRDEEGTSSRRFQRSGVMICSGWLAQPGVHGALSPRG